jgi:hypothetical protein
MRIGRLFDRLRVFNGDIRMQRSALAALAAVALVSLPASAGDQPVRRAWNNFCRDFHRNNCWPDPFIAPDRAAVRAPINVMVAQGWKVQNTLGDHHFEGDTAKLTEAGELKVRAILAQSPADFRTIFVLRADDPKLTADRIESTQHLATKLVQDGVPPQVVETTEKPRGTPAYYIDEVTRRYQSTTPDPRLPTDNDSSDSSSAGNSQK